MREKTLGKIYLIVGIYLSIIHPILSINNNRIYTIGGHVPLSPLEYWSEWLWRYGLFAILLAGIGVFFIRASYLRLKESEKE